MERDHGVAENEAGNDGLRGRELLVTKIRKRPVTSSSGRPAQQRRRSLEALKKSEERFRLVVEAFPNAMVMADGEGKIVLVNAQTEKLFGYKRRELLGRTIELLVPRRFRGEHAGLRQGFHRDPRPRPMGAGRDLFGLRKDGTEVPVEVGLNSLGAPEGLVLASIIDITERKRSENQLSDSEDKFRLLTEKSMAGVYLIQDGLFRYVNPTLAGIFGYDADELTGKKGPQDLVLPEDWPIVRGNLGRRLSGEVDSLSYRFRGRKKDGETIDVEVLGSRIEYSGKPAVIGTLLEITKRRKIESELRESEARYRALVDLAPIGIVVHERGTVRFVNRMMAEALEAETPEAETPEELLGRDVMDFIHPDDSERVMVRVKKSAEGIALPPVEEKLVTLTGKVLDVELRTAPITYMGRPCTLAAVLDITARKQDEAVIRELNAELEKRVEQRTAQLREVNISLAGEVEEHKKTEAELGAANRDLEAFSSAVSHDLRAPLRHIAAFTKLLEADIGPGLKEETRRYFEVIAASAAEMGALIDSLLRLSLMSRATPEFQEFSGRELAEEAAAEIRRDNPGREIEWKIGDIPTLKGDRVMLKQVFLNLLNNATKYSRDRKPARIEVFSRDEGNGTVIGVRDNGIGFDMKYIDKLFNAFQRLHTTAEFEGSGIGLANVKRVVLKHGGRVWAESVPGKSTTFYFALPSAAK